MFSKPSTMFLLLGAAVAIPFAANKASKFSGFPGFGGSENSSAVSTDLVDGASAGGINTLTPVVARQGQGNAYPRIASVLRMDISPAWVYQHWNRKSTKLANLDRFGVRVPFVSGTEPDDIAGSLTYYFGANQQVERISFHGRTGDPRSLNYFVTKHYAITPQPPIHPGEQLFQSKWNHRVKSELRLKLAPVISSKTNLNAYEISLELERPNSNFFLEDERKAEALQQAQPEKAKEAAEQAKKAEEETKTPKRWIQGPPMSRSLFFNPQHTKPIVKPE